jgi:NADH-quinone oxidoreductase subunit L
MLWLLWLVPVLPIFGFCLQVLLGPRLSRTGIAILGAGSIGLSLLFALLVSARFLSAPPPSHVYTQKLWTWFHVGSLAPGITFYLDPLSMIFMLVVTFVSFLIHLYSAGFMIDEEGYSRFFAYMNLFVGSMLTLVLADNLLLLYMGWEGVGLCSYLLIGFWYKDPANGAAARKAFIVTRVGDTAMAIGLFLIFTHLGAFDIQELMRRALVQWPAGSGLAVAAAGLLLGGALGKSAQLPLQTWLPDAMAGPTPVSALIHAATMVTAGVYLIARTHVLFTLAPVIETAVAAIGAATLLVAGFSALTQWDIKRVLAYSTISQIGYMFLTLGVGAWSAAIFHFMTHAFFKALLFLAAGVVIEGLHHEHDMRRMGGLRAQLPLTFWTFLMGACSLAAVPVITAGFYSKDLILWYAWSSPLGGMGLWIAALVGAFLTSLYTFRMVFMTFFGPPRYDDLMTRGGDGLIGERDQAGSSSRDQALRSSGPQVLIRQPRLSMQIPLVVLAFLSIVGGCVESPRALGGVTLFSDFLHTALPAAAALPARAGSESLFELIAGLVSLFGIFIAYVLYLQSPQVMEGVVRMPLGAALQQFWYTGWGFDWLYDRLLVRPYVWLARADKNDVVDLIYAGIAGACQALYHALSRTETGKVRWYAAGIGFGALVIIAIVVLS